MPRYKVSRAKMQVEVRGVIYPDCATAAEALGVAKATVYSAAQRGTTDTLGLGQRAPHHTGGITPKPFAIGSVKFPSRRAASVALGMSAPYISSIFKRGGKRAKANLVARAMYYQSRVELTMRQDRLQKEQEDENVVSQSGNNVS